MLRMLTNLFAGALFGLGLAVSGMVDPAKVIGFLDVTGDWDPTLAVVFGGALLVTIPAFRLILKRQRPVLEDDFALPTKDSLDARLLGGAAVFGVGWGLAGVLSRSVGDGAGLRACAGVRVRRGDDRGDGGLQVDLLAAGSRRREVAS